MNLYCFYTPSHEVFFKEWFEPSASKEYTLFPKKHSDQISKTATYAEDGWRETQYKKVLYWKKAVEDNMGDLIVCSDVDIQFLNNSKDFLSKAIKGSDIAFQQNQKGGPICSGFFICRCSLKTLNFFDIISKRLKKIMHKPGGGEQYQMWKLLNEDWYDFDIVKLSHDRIWTPGFKYKNLEDLNIPHEILIHHANFSEGIDNKIDQLDYVKSIYVQRNAPWPSVNISNLNLPKNKNSIPKIALCTSSLLRDFDVASYSLIQRVFSSLPCKPDFIGHFPSKSKTKNNLKVLNKIKEHSSDFIVKFEKDPPLNPDHKEMTENMSVQKHGAIGNLYQWLSMRSCARMIEKQEAKNGFRYDWVIWTRPDLHFFNSLENLLNLDNKFIHFPAHDNHLHGLYDRFCLGNSDDMLQRMHIYEYFTKKWYPECHNDKDLLTWSPYRECYLWNPELCLKHYIKKELKLKNKKLNLCSGKLREKYFARVPFWYSIYGTDRTGYKCSDDIVNYEVLNKIKHFNPYKVFHESPWHAVNVLEDSIMSSFPNNYSFDLANSIESKIMGNNEETSGPSFIKKMMKNIDEKLLQKEIDQ